MVCEMAIMNHTGDLKVFWDTEKPAEVENARQQYDALMKKGYRGYRLGREGEQGEVMGAFDPHAGRMIMAPAMVGG